MKVKTTLKVGLADYGAAVQKIFQDAGQITTTFWQKALSTLTNPKFWTWPF